MLVELPCKCLLSCAGIGRCEGTRAASRWLAQHVGKAARVLGHLRPWHGLCLHALLPGRQATGLAHCSKHRPSPSLPAGAVPKDGPSAGVTLAAALVSLFTGKCVRADAAMTGGLGWQGFTPSRKQGVASPVCAPVGRLLWREAVPLSSHGPVSLPCPPIVCLSPGPTDNLHLTVQWRPSIAPHPPPAYCTPAHSAGELTLRGLVLPVGGIKEKLLAAQAAGMARVLVPARNMPDVQVGRSGSGWPVQSQGRHACRVQRGRLAAGPAAAAAPSRWCAPPVRRVYAADSPGVLGLHRLLTAHMPMHACLAYPGHLPLCRRTCRLLCARRCGCFPARGWRMC